MRHREARWLGDIRARKDDLGNGRILVACSGGPDSTALLFFLHSVAQSLRLELMVAHIDHGLRPESPEDADFVRTLCRQLELDLVEIALDVRSHAQKQQLGLESAARELRWAWLKTEAASCGADRIATGHHLEDHTETVFIRLSRGSGLGCLTPLPPIQGSRWSPLIQVRRSELREYLRERGVTWREDASNQEPFTARNRWRPLLEGFRREAPKLDEHLLETHRQLEELVDVAELFLQRIHGEKWLTDPKQGLFLRPGEWKAAELSLVLERGFRELDWERSAHTLMALREWLLPRLSFRHPKPSCWGTFRLDTTPQACWLMLV